MSCRNDSVRRLQDSPGGRSVGDPCAAPKAGTELQKVGHTCVLLDYRGFGWQRVWLSASRRRLLPRHRRRQSKRRSRMPSRPPAAKVAAPESQQPPAASRQAAIEQEQAAKVPTLHPYVPIKGERIFNRLDTIIAGGGAEVASVLHERVFGRRLHAGRGLQPLREQLQHDRRARQLYPHRLQTRRGRVPGTAHLQPPRQPVAARRLARGHASRLLRHRDGHVEGRPDQLPVPAAVRLGAPHRLPDAAELHAAGRRRVHDVVAGARRGHVTIGGDQIHAG